MEKARPALLSATTSHVSMKVAGLPVRTSIGSGLEKVWKWPQSDRCGAEAPAVTPSLIATSASGASSSFQQPISCSRTAAGPSSSAAERA